jgi:hypothetical protein
MTQTNFLGGCSSGRRRERQRGGDRRIGARRGVDADHALVAHHAHSQSPEGPHGRLNLRPRVDLVHGNAVQSVEVCKRDDDFVSGALELARYPSATSWFPRRDASLADRFENERIHRVHLLDRLNERLAHPGAPPRVHRSSQ